MTWRFLTVEEKRLAGEGLLLPEAPADDLSILIAASDGATAAHNDENRGDVWHGS